MPFRRRFNFRKRRPTTRFNKRPRYGLATRPRMFGRYQARRRQLGTDTRVMYFKLNGIITTTSTSPNQWNFWRTNALGTAPGLTPPSFVAASRLYDQYKILGMTLKLFPANLYDNYQSPTGLRRGNHAVWTDLRFDVSAVAPSTIQDVINYASTKIIIPSKKYSRSIFRPQGKPQWGSCRDILTSADPWSGSIEYLINGATITPAGSPEILMFWTNTFKVLFRGRTEN